MADFHVVICGGGIAAVEGLLRLRALAGDAVDVDLIAPNDELVYRPLAVREPFAFGPARRYPLRRIVRDTDAKWIKDTLGWVDREAQVVHTGDGREIAYDALLVAVGATLVEPYKHVGTFHDAQADEPSVASSRTSSLATRAAWRSSSRSVRSGRCRCTSLH